MDMRLWRFSCIAAGGFLSFGFYYSYFPKFAPIKFTVTKAMSHYDINSTYNADVHVNSHALDLLSVGGDVSSVVYSLATYS